MYTSSKRELIWQKKLSSVIPTTQVHLSTTQLTKPSLTSVMDCDRIIMEYLDTKSLKSLSCINRYFDVLYKECRASNVFWKNKLERIYALYSTKTNLPNMRIVQYFERDTFPNCCKNIQYNVSAELRQHIIQLLYDNDIDIITPYKNVIRNKYVSDASMPEENKIILRFGSNEADTLTLFAEADCCSHSWFEMLEDDLSFLIGKKILSIDDISYIDMADDATGGYDSIQNHLIQIRLVGGDIFEFVLRNDSNGYYDGSLDIR